MLKFFKKFRIKRRLVSTMALWHFFGNSSKKLKIIGVTGTNGKTTVATLLFRVTSALGYKAGLISTVENIIGFAGNVISQDEKGPGTTPDPIYLNRILSKMVKEGCEYVFMEVSSHALDQGRVNGINFAGGIFTNLTHDHLDYHKDLENYFRAKKKFFEMLPSNAFALSNVDDEHGNAMLDSIKAEKFFYGFGNDTEAVDFYGKILKLDFSGLELDFNGEKIRSKLLGRFNAYNLLAVWATCKLLGFDMLARNALHSEAGGKKVNKILENIEPPRGRFDYYVSQSGVIVIIDYAHTPDALEKVLLTIREIKFENSKIISVFGCGGDRDPLKRSKMGKIGASLSDIAIFTSDNPRSENPDKIIDDMKSDLAHEETVKVITIADRRLAIEEAAEMAQKGDIILCAGKGHEEYQEIKGAKHHFDDMEEFRKAYS
ncbi:UDP-N-acetylmuramoyl-L-alanyl-D-glutamate--2,6-diaminopimelate ligase [Candidatus Nomurabacteria bacterium CG_4_9_14_0_2_um_filter_32_10]|uniref:UDP-N-acetylmuramoyl-L-alanyl-D-glutamate--2,6-diaminopimelate ligase n=2 Tax=Candidatus Nomuraibacteriota TaxID=1752729 RepID=A0A2J0N5V9_9BACT|nr:MAG: UDP-N-acetylmuramoyl-L-alanyl-D-glutamate--2,6-diaminopimelate ligase [Candidatus Nomurabacteria bacterium CG_4_9_14_0_2_um_filter_32_10]